MKETTIQEYWQRTLPLAAILTGITFSISHFLFKSSILYAAVLGSLWGGFYLALTFFNFRKDNAVIRQILKMQEEFMSGLSHIHLKPKKGLVTIIVGVPSYVEFVDKIPHLHVSTVKLPEREVDGTQLIPMNDIKKIEHIG